MTDARKNAELNGVHLMGASTAKVSWDAAYPRPEWNDPSYWASARPTYEEAA